MKEDISPKTLNKTQRRRFNHSMGYILVKEKYGAVSCEGASKRS